MMSLAVPRLIVASPFGGAGKSLVTWALERLWLRRGRNVRAVSLGPTVQEILASTSANPSLPESSVDGLDLSPLGLGTSPCSGVDALIIDGFQGLYDPIGPGSLLSTARLAARTRSPLLLVLDITKVTRTILAQAMGCFSWQSGLLWAGVILNKASGERHADVTRRALENWGELPVLGVLPRKASYRFPFDSEDAGRVDDLAACLDGEELWRRASLAPALPLEELSMAVEPEAVLYQERFSATQPDRLYQTPSSLP